MCERSGWTLELTMSTHVGYAPMQQVIPVGAQIEIDWLLFPATQVMTKIATIDAALKGARDRFSCKLYAKEMGVGPWQLACIICRL